MKLPPIDHEETLQAYLDGDMSPDERAAFEQQLASDDDLRSETEDTRALVSLLRGLPAYDVPRSFALTPEMVRAAGAPTPRVIRLLPVVRSLAVAAMLAFVVVSALTAYQLVTETGDDSVTNQPTNASEQSTGDADTDDGVVTGVGESAASGAVPPEQPGSAELPHPSDTGSSSSQPDDSASTGSAADDQTIWLLSSAGLGVLALVLGGYWVYLVRTGSPAPRPV